MDQGVYTNAKAKPKNYTHQNKGQHGDLDLEFYSNLGE